MAVGGGGRRANSEEEAGTGWYWWVVFYILESGMIKYSLVHSSTPCYTQVHPGALWYTLTHFGTLGTLLGWFWHTLVHSVTVLAHSKAAIPQADHSLWVEGSSELKLSSTNIITQLSCCTGQCQWDEHVEKDSLFKHRPILKSKHFKVVTYYHQPSLWVTWKYCLM